MQFDSYACIRDTQKCMSVYTHVKYTNIRRHMMHKKEKQLKKRETIQPSFNR